ncbi:hypothetical protein [Rhizohabitans arisaemae]|nr:hypothetical protein [Rhizohabitans arisaemae]
MELRWWILLSLSAVLLVTATWWWFSRSAHVRRGLDRPAGKRKDS